MSKKRFSEGLDELFRIGQESHSETLGQAVVLTAPSVMRNRKVLGHKSFMTGLDTLIQEAMDESIERYESSQPDSAPASSKTKATISNTLRAPARNGLDMLIRQTIDVQEVAMDESTGKKRLTVAVDRPKLEKLKAIAKLENAFLKDLLISLIDEYIDEYTHRNNIDLKS